MKSVLWFVDIHFELGKNVQHFASSIYKHRIHSSCWRYQSIHNDFKWFVINCKRTKILGKPDFHVQIKLILKSTSDIFVMLSTMIPGWVDGKCVFKNMLVFVTKNSNSITNSKPLWGDLYKLWSIKLFSMCYTWCFFVSSFHWSKDWPNMYVWKYIDITLHHL